MIWRVLGEGILSKGRGNVEGGNKRRDEIREKRETREMRDKRYDGTERKGKEDDGDCNNLSRGLLWTPLDSFGHTPNGKCKGLTGGWDKRPASGT